MNYNLILKNIQVQFFKSIGNTTIEIPDLAVFVGKNAAGKSNIVSVFRFLRDLAAKGYQTAMQQQGGIDILFNSFASELDSIQIKTQFEFSKPSFFTMRPEDNGEVSQSIKDGTYETKNWEEEYPPIISGIAISMTHTILISREGKGYSTSETLKIDAVLHSSLLNASYFKIIHKFDNISSENWQGEYVFVSQSREGFLNYSIIPPSSNSIEPIPSYIKSPTKHIFLSKNEIGKKTLFEVEPIWGSKLQEFYSSIGIFDFIPKLIKSATHTTGNATLDEDGGNINIILQNILQDEEKRRTFMNLVRYVLPFIDDVEIDVPRNGLAMPVIRENYNDRFRLPAEFFSDGTATVIAIIVALFFEENSIVVIEEPERYVHPAIMDKLATLFEDAARYKKVVVTTHSPDLIRHLKPEHVQLVSRDKDHFTQIRRVTEDEEIKSFLAGEMQLDDLLVNNFFEG